MARARGQRAIPAELSGAQVVAHRLRDETRAVPAQPQPPRNVCGHPLALGVVAQEADAASIFHGPGGGFRHVVKQRGQLEMGQPVVAVADLFAEPLGNAFHARQRVHHPIAAPALAQHDTL